MISENLYALAFQYAETKPWEKLSDSDIFAVRLQDGETGYCCVMGMAGDYRALGLYVGQEGWSSYIRMLEAASAGSDPVEILCQDCLMCALEEKGNLLPSEMKDLQDYAGRHGVTLRDAYPVLRRFRPGCMPWRLEDAREARLLEEALAAALKVAAELQNIPFKHQGIGAGAEIPILEREKGSALRWGTALLPAPLPLVFPAPAFTNDVLSAKIWMSPKAGIWECAVQDFPEMVQEGPDSAPYFPAMLMMVECESGFVMPMTLSGPYALAPERVLESAAAAMSRNEIYPELMVPGDDRTRELLGDFCRRTGVDLADVQETPVLDQARKTLMERYRT